MGYGVDTPFEDIKKDVIENAMEYTDGIENLTLVQRVEAFILNEREQNQRDEIACDNMNDDADEREEDMLEHVEYVHQLYDVLLDLMKQG